ncbi:MAG: L,D-transpeptidase [Actinomycetota bacterium]|nr:L,D-transpeptidase [Actinomycetota bacterium]
MSKPNFSRFNRSAVLLTASLALLVSACSSGSSPNGNTTVTKTAGAAGSSGGSTSAASSTSAKPVVPAAQRVHIKTLNSDGVSYGVGMPVIAFFSRKFTTAAALQKATVATVNGKPTAGAWYFEPSSGGNGPLEGHYRPQAYWPAHSKVHIGIPAKGLAAGKDLIFDNSLTLDFSIGARNITTVDNSTHHMTVTTDGAKWGSFPVSLGAPATRTRSGIKVIMEKGRSICMHGPGYNECGVKWTQRLTYDGEYLHAAPWNTSNIANGVNSSNGCTNMTTADADRLYHHLEVGDVVTYPNADGDGMTLGEGYGDWNVQWSEWQTGGAVTTS